MASYGLNARAAGQTRKNTRRRDIFVSFYRSLRRIIYLFYSITWIAIWGVGQIFFFSFVTRKNFGKNQNAEGAFQTSRGSFAVFW